MAAGSSKSSNDTVSDGLKKLFTQISQLKLMPDAQQHMQFITMLEQGVMQYLQNIGSQMAQMGAGGSGGSPGSGGQGPGGGGGPGPAPSPGGPPSAAQFAPGGASGGGNVGMAVSPNPDELQRVLQQAGGPG